MPELTEAQKQYIKEHSKEPSVTIARNLGIGRQQAYYWLCKFHGAEITFARNGGLSEKQRAVLELYPTHSASEIGRVLGLTKAAVNCMAHRLGVKHTEETSRRMMNEAVSKAVRPETVRKRTEKRKRTMAMERLRILSGEKQVTKQKLTRLPNKSLCIRHYLINKYNYFYDKEIGEPLTLFFDSETNRLSGDRERYYSDKYHLKFVGNDE